MSPEGDGHLWYKGDCFFQEIWVHECCTGKFRDEKHILRFWEVLKIDPEGRGSVFLEYESMVNHDELIHARND